MFNIIHGFAKAFSGMNMAASVMGAGAFTSLKSVDHPVHRSRGTLVRHNMRRACSLFLAHYTSNHNVAGTRVSSVKRKHM